LIACAVINSLLVTTLHAIVGEDNTNINRRPAWLFTGLRALINAGLVVGTIVTLVGDILKISIVGLVVGQAIAMSTSFGLTLANGFLTLKIYDMDEDDWKELQKRNPLNVLDANLKEKGLLSQLKRDDEEIV